jgi:hypothetical protein
VIGFWSGRTSWLTSYASSWCIGPRESALHFALQQLAQRTLDDADQALATPSTDTQSVMLQPSPFNDAKPVKQNRIQVDSLRMLIVFDQTNPIGPERDHL